MRGFLTEQVSEKQKQQIDLSERREEKRMMKMMKRKELDVDDVSDDLHDFSLSSPARKIRRLNAQLPPIMEEEREQDIFGVESSPNSILEDTKIVSVSDHPVNEEKAIVLYNYNPFLQSSPSPNVSVSLDLKSGFKNQFLRANHSGNMKLAEDDEYLHGKNDATASNSLAVVPWVPSQFLFPPTTPAVDASQMEVTELMEADDMGEATMDIEENDNPSIDQGNAYEFGGMSESDGLNQWQQQHCMMPLLPQSTSTPITWFR